MIKKLAYISILTSLLGASVFAIDMEIFQLSVFRFTILLILGALILQKNLDSEKIYLTSKRNNRYSIQFMFVWLLYSFLSITWAISYVNWIKAIYYISIGVVCIIAYNKCFKSIDDILKAFRLISIMTIVHNLIGWFEIITGKYFFISNDKIYKYAYYDYPVSMFNNTNNFALYMFFSVFLIYVCMVNSKTKLSKITYFITMISSILLLIATNSRGCMWGLIIGLLVQFWLTHKRWRYLIIIFSFLSSLLILMLPDVFNNLSYFIDKYLMFNLFSEYGSDFVRVNLIKNGFIFLLETFGFGTGAGNIEYWIDNFSVYNTYGINNMHNWWMEILVGYGVIIFILYIIFYIKLIRNMLHRFNLAIDKKDRSISLAIISYMSGFIIASISPSSIIGIEWLWVIWAITIAYQGMDNVNLEKSYNTKEIL